MTEPTGAPQPSQNPPRPPTGVGDETPAIASEELLRGKKAVIITHAGESYRLIVTRNDKLLLQK